MDWSKSVKFIHRPDEQSFLDPVPGEKSFDDVSIHFQPRQKALAETSFFFLHHVCDTLQLDLFSG